MAEEGIAFLSPEAVIMLPLAILIDLVGIILIIFALDDFFVTDVIAIISIGGWSYFRSMARGKTQEAEMPSFGEGRKTKKAARQAKKVGKKVTKVSKWAKRLKWLRPLLIVGEIIPYVGVIPLWTVFVFLELKYS